MKDVLKRIGKNVLLSLTSIIVLFLAIEAIIRLFYPQEIGLHQRSNTLKIKLTPNYRGRVHGWHVNVNSIGLRDREFGRKEKGVFRILALGDSQTYGLGVEIEDTYPKILEGFLNKNTSKQKFEVINAGVDTYSTFQEFQYLKESGFKLEPDLILVGFYIGNDFGENNAFSVLKFIERKSYNKLDLFLSSRSHAYNFLKNRFYKLLARNAMKSRKKDEVVKSIRIGLDDIYFPNPMTFCKKDYTPEMAKAVEVTKRKLLEIASFASSHNAKILLIIIPVMHQVYEKEWYKNSKAYNLSPQSFDITKPNTILSQFAKDEEIPVLDLLPSFRQFAKNKKLYFWEGHLNQEGYRAAGEEIYRALISYGLISIQ